MGLRGPIPSSIFVSLMLIFLLQSFSVGQLPFTIMKFSSVLIGKIKNLYEKLFDIFVEKYFSILIAKVVPLH